MKRKSITLAITAFSALAAVSSQGATVLGNWTFETSIPTTAGPHAAEAGLFAATSNASSNTGGTFSNPVGNGSAESFSSNGWDIGEYFQFSTSTTGFDNIVVGFSHTSSGTGPGEFTLAYQVNGGGFANFLDYTVLPNSATAPGLGTWGSVTEIAGYNYSFDLSSVTALDNAASVDFRLIMRSTADATPPGIVAGTGTSRVDNVSITSIPEPSTALLGGLGLLALLRRRR